MNLSLFDIFSGTAGGIGSVMAALGALKLGALTFLHRDSLDIKTRSTLHKCTYMMTRATIAELAHWL